MFYQVTVEKVEEQQSGRTVTTVTFVADVRT